MVHEAHISNCRIRQLNFFVSLFAMAVICLAGQQTFACLCKPMSPKERTKFMKRNADVIFTGIVSSTVQLSVSRWEGTFLVSNIWKGEPSVEIKVQSSGGCRVGFVVGKPYLITENGTSRECS